MYNLLSYDTALRNKDIIKKYLLHHSKRYGKSYMMCRMERQIQRIEKRGVIDGQPN